MAKRRIDMGLISETPVTVGSASQETDAVSVPGSDPPSEALHEKWSLDV